MEGLKNRAVALIVCTALVLVGWFGGSAIQEMGGRLITADAAGVKANETAMQVGTEEVTMGEYLYWVTAVCDSMYQYYGVTDWSVKMTEDMTLEEYVKTEADYYAKQYAGVRQLAAEKGVSLTEEQQEMLDGMHDYWCQMYGEEAVYEYMLRVSGLTEDMLVENNISPFLYNNLCDQLLAEGGELEPTEENVKAFLEKYELGELGEEERMSAYLDPEHGAIPAYMDEYIAGLEVTMSPAHDALDLNVYYPALTEAREQLPKPEVEPAGGTDDLGSAQE